MNLIFIKVQQIKSDPLCFDGKKKDNFVKMNREELEEVFNRVYVGQFKKKEKKKVYDGSKTLDRNYFSRHRRVCNMQH